MAKICVVGSCNIDLTFLTPRLPRAGETIARIQLGESPRDADELTKRYLSFVTFGDEKPEERPLIHEHLV